MRWIQVYKPKCNYQKAIFNAIDRYLTTHPATLEPSQSLQPSPPLPTEIFVAPPVRRAARDPVPERLQRLGQKFDAVGRDPCHRFLVKAGVAFVGVFESRRLTR